MKHSDITKINLLYENSRNTFLREMHTQDGNDNRVFLTKEEKRAFRAGVLFSVNHARTFPDINNLFAEDYPEFTHSDRLNLIEQGTIGDLLNLSDDQLNWMIACLERLDDQYIAEDIRPSDRSVIKAARQSAIKKINNTIYRKSATKDIDPDLGFGDLIDVL